MSRPSESRALKTPLTVHPSTRASEVGVALMCPEGGKLGFCGAQSSVGSVSARFDVNSQFLNDMSFLLQRIGLD
jgi:hypothetical protein